MVVECLSVIVLILVFICMAYRKGARRAAVVTLPLVVLPLVHVLLTPFSVPISGLIPGVGPELFAVAIDLLGLAASCVLLGVNAQRFRSRRARRSYMLLCAGYSFLFCLVLIKGLIGPLLPVF